MQPINFASQDNFKKEQLLLVLAEKKKKQDKLEFVSLFHNSEGYFCDLNTRFITEYTDDLKEICRLTIEHIVNFHEQQEKFHELPIIIICLVSYDQTLDSALDIRSLRGVFAKIPLLVIDCYFTQDQRIELLDLGEVDLLLDLPIKKELFVAQINSILRRAKN